MRVLGLQEAGEKESEDGIGLQVTEIIELTFENVVSCVRGQLEISKI